MKIMKTNEKKWGVYRYPIFSYISYPSLSARNRSKSRLKTVNYTFTVFFIFGI